MKQKHCAGGRQDALETFMTLVIERGSGVTDKIFENACRLI